MKGKEQPLLEELQKIAQQPGVMQLANSLGFPSAIKTIHDTSTMLAKEGEYEDAEILQKAAAVLLKQIVKLEKKPT